MDESRSPLPETDNPAEDECWLSYVEGDFGDMIDGEHGNPDYYKSQYSYYKG